MTKSEINIAAAEARGWKNCRCLEGGNIPYGEPNDDYNEDYPTDPHIEMLPNIVSDANAQRDAFLETTEEQRDSFESILMEIIGREGFKQTIIEAFFTHFGECYLKALEKWRDG